MTVPPSPNEPPAAGEFYTWRAHGAALVVQLSLDCVSRLDIEIQRGFALVPRRGAEVGGLLLGSIQAGMVGVSIAGWTVVVRDFVTIPLSYARGPSYLLTPQEIEEFGEALASAEGREPNQRVVGFFRSHTREGFGLAPDDMTLLDRYLTDPRQVALLVRPFATKPGIAGFLFRREGSFPANSPTPEFTFRARDLGSTEAPRIAPRPAAPTPLFPPAPPPVPRASDPPTVPAPPAEPVAIAPVPVLAPPPAPEPTALSRPPEPEQSVSLRTRLLEKEQEYDQLERARRQHLLLWLPLTLLALLLGSLAGYAYRDRPQVADYQLSLAADQQDDRLIVLWDSQARAIQAASKAVLTIAESGTEQTRELSRDQLRAGKAIYGRLAPEMRCTLRVWAGEKSAVEESTVFRPRL